jgi:hypothetical protein
LKRDLREGRLAANEIREPAILRHLGLVRRQRAHLSDATEDLVALLVERMRGEADKAFG